jgi:copper chaperone
MTRSWTYLAALVLSVPLAWAGEPAKTTLRVEGMTCGGCVAAVKIQLKRTEGVTAYEVSLEKAEADVSYDSEKTTPKKIAESVSKTGFKVSVKGKKDEGSGTKQGAFAPLDLKTLKLCLNPSRLTREALTLLDRKG